MKIKKNIIFVTENFEIGGVSTFINDYVRYLNTNGYRTIVMGEEGPANVNTGYFQGSRVIAIPHTYNHKNRGNLILSIVDRVNYFINFSRVFRRLMNEENPDIVHLNLTWSSLPLLFFNPEIYRIKRVITFYGDKELEIRSITKNQNFGLLFSIKLKLIGILQKITLCFSTKIIVFSNYAVNLVNKRFGIPKSKIVVIPGVIFKNDYANVQNNNAHKFNKLIDIINISRYERRKGQDVLLKAFKIIVNKNVNAKLTFCGPMEGGILDLLNVYEDLELKNAVQFLHNYNSVDKLSLIQSSDLFVIPSRELETFGMTIIEAMACGIPVIGTPVGSIPEILNLVDKRLVSKSITPKSLSTTILNYLGLPPSEKRIIINKSRDVAFKYFEANKVLKKLELLYQNM